MKITDFGYPSKREVHCRFGSTIMYTSFQYEFPVTLPGGTSVPETIAFFDTNTYDSRTGDLKDIPEDESEEIKRQLRDRILNSPEINEIIEDHISDPYDDYQDWLECLKTGN